MGTAEPGPADGMAIRQRLLLVVSRTATVSPFVVVATAIDDGLVPARPAFTETMLRSDKVTTLTVASPEFATYAYMPSALTAMATGFSPTASGVAVAGTGGLAWMSVSQMNAPVPGKTPSNRSSGAGTTARRT